MGNAITGAGGFALATHGNFVSSLFLAALLGISLIVASACVLNNYIDRDADQKMQRTKERALAKGTISTQNALIFAVALNCIGTLILAFFTNFLTLLITALGFFIYVLFYSTWKYRTVYGTLIGSVAGAVPPLAGYVAASNHLDTGAFLVFLIVALWQMPHFYAISLYRYEDYAAASIPVLPVVKGTEKTKIHMLAYVTIFSLAAISPTLVGYTGYGYLSVSALLGLLWLRLSLQGFKAENTKKWARKMFQFSLIVITALCAMISLDRL
jgi:protoheme IX farnesyltransferase